VWPRYEQREMNNAQPVPLAHIFFRRQGTHSRFSRLQTKTT
jgi:hypothetical protein